MLHDVTIDYLKYHQEYVITCAKWAHSEWGKYTPEKSVEDFIETCAYPNDDQLPLTLIALDRGKSVGMCSLTESRDVCPELSPWLGALYVIPEYRKRGIESMLEEKICAKAREFGFSKIYLFTSDPNMIPWYEKHDWRKKCMQPLHDHEVTVMEKMLH